MTWFLAYLAIGTFIGWIGEVLDKQEIGNTGFLVMVFLWPITLAIAIWLEVKSRKKRG